MEIMTITHGRASGFYEGVFGVATALLGRGPRSRRRWRFLKRSAEGQTWLFEVEMTQRRVAVQDRPAVVRSPGRSCRRLS